MEVVKATRPKGLDDPDSGDGLNKLAKSEQGGLRQCIYKINYEKTK
jgi:hypothetical protein